jgi:cytochrome P450
MHEQAIAAATKADALFDPYCPAWVANPYPYFRRLRDEAPVYYSATHKVWVLSRHADVTFAQFHPELFISSEGLSIEGTEKGLAMLIFKDPPEHSWYKRLVTKVFSQNRMAAMAPFIRERAGALLEAVADRDSVDIIDAFALRLPLDVISALLDIPEDRRDEVHYWTTRALQRGPDWTPERVRETYRARTDIFLELIAERHVVPHDDVITVLMNMEVDDEEGRPRRLSDMEIAVHFMELGLAGHETAARTIGNGLLALHHFPAQRAMVQADPALIPAMVEEIVRYDPPSQYQGRVTTADVAFHGVTIPKGSRVMLLVAAAANDDRLFADPERFDIMRRPDSKSVYFGTGIHKCLGIHLARLEMTIAFEELLRRCPNHRIDPASATRGTYAGMRGVDRLTFYPRG